MPLTRPFPIDSASPNPIDIRKQNSAIYPREGIFPDPVTIAAAGIAYANGGWNVGARPFVANIKRGGGAFTQAYGSAQISNDSAATAWTIAAAPASGTRVDRLWIRATDPTQGEALTGGIAVPVFGVTAGTPALAALPAGVEEIAQVSVAAGAASIANATITQTYSFAHVLGAPIYCRTEAERDALTPVMDGEVAYVIAEKAAYVKTGGVWMASAGAVHSRQLDTTSSLVVPRFESGIGRIQGNNTTQLTKAFLFREPFADTPVVTLSYTGYRGTGAFNPVGLAVGSAQPMSPMSVTTTGFTAYLTSGGSLTNTSDFYFNWIAVGVAV